MNKIYFISGHGDLTFEEFLEHYKPKIDEALVEDASFIMGDFRGADVLAQEYLKNKTGQVIIYHCFSKPRYLVDTIGLRSKEWRYMSGFDSDSTRDAKMTEYSTHDIAWVRPGKEKSGTQKNLNRRNYV
jgi:hypothetical protein